MVRECVHEARRNISTRQRAEHLAQRAAEEDSATDEDLVVERRMPKRRYSLVEERRSPSPIPAPLIPAPRVNDFCDSPSEDSSGSEYDPGYRSSD